MREEGGRRWYVGWARERKNEFGPSKKKE